MSARHDPGLRAVARVRGVREQDSRLGLQQALAEQRAREHRVALLQDRLDATPAFTTGSAHAFVADREIAAALGRSLQAAQTDVASGHTVTEEARGRWQTDRTRLAAVEMLLERRAAARRDERARLEARELDEMATQRWQRTEQVRP